MAKDYTALPYNEVRRADRAMNDEAWIKTMLNHAAMGYLATVHEGQPFINSNIFVYDEAAHVIYMHTARVGRTRGNIDEHDRVCFTVTEMGRLLPAETALEFSVEYAGVVVFGTAEVMHDEAAASHALQLLLDNYFPHLEVGVDYRGVIPEELKRTSVYRINIEQWSGKRKEVAPDFPGAFMYGAWPVAV